LRRTPRPHHARTVRQTISQALRIRPALEPLEDRTVPSLVAAYAFNEGSGSTAADASGTGNTGTIAGATWAAGKFDQALAFNGTSSWVTVAGSSSLNLTTGMTLEAWVRPTAAAPDWTAAVIKERPGGLAYALYAADGAGKPPAGYINQDGADVHATGPAVLPLNTWTHLAATYDGSTIRLYVNGSQVASTARTGAITTSTSPLRIGGDSVWGEYFTGLIDEVRVYNRALSQTEIQTDMNIPVG
jgi:hypothetical protein